MEKRERMRESLLKFFGIGLGFCSHPTMRRWSVRLPSSTHAGRLPKLSKKKDFLGAKTKKKLCLRFFKCEKDFLSLSLSFYTVDHKVKVHFYSKCLPSPPPHRPHPHKFFVYDVYESSLLYFQLLY